MKTYVMAIANQKGGVGKTTTAVNLSAALTAQGRQILLVDLDPQGNATSGLGMEKSNSLYHYLLEKRGAGDCIRPSPYKRLDTIPGELDMAGAEVDLAGGDHALLRLRHSLSEVVASGRYDFIILDCPPSLGIITMNALSAAQGILVPIQCEYYALEGLGVMVQLIRRLRNSSNPGLELLGILMTMFDPRTNLSRQVVEEVRSHFGDKVYTTVIPRSVRLSEAPSYGRPILVHDPHGSGSSSYLELAREVADSIRSRPQDSAALHAAGSSKSATDRFCAPPKDDL